MMCLSDEGKSSFKYGDALEYKEQQQVEQKQDSQKDHEYEGMYVNCGWPQDHLLH